MRVGERLRKLSAVDNDERQDVSLCNLLLLDRLGLRFSR